MKTKTKKQVKGKAKRQRFSTEFKQQALLRAVKNGVPAAARDLGLQAAQLYAWRAQSQSDSQEVEARGLLQSEAAQLKRELGCLEKENAFLKRRITVWSGYQVILPLLLGHADKRFNIAIRGGNDEWEEGGSEGRA